jgi:hypothetical protein
MTRSRWYLCGVPESGCTGFRPILPKHYVDRGSPVLVHNTTREAFLCMKKHLLRQGYIQIGGREFSPPGGGPVLVLTKSSRYGGKMRRGKMGRVMPAEPHGYGAIIG